MTNTFDSGQQKNVYNDRLLATMVLTTHCLQSSFCSNGVNQYNNSLASYSHSQSLTTCNQQKARLAQRRYDMVTSPQRLYACEMLLLIT